ncbi:MAG: DNA mismatch repair protein MutS [Bacilli bacterium]|uniref:DNA mismatch repair protein MutS n=1 Tax=Ureibacillus suwonensis TaxID=313007 RepID=A0ABW0R8R8_9BACL|nr:DNA mismatch repair protein MutS [Bacilli bacterium]
MTTYTPMMQQYLTIKSEYEDAFLFFRLGDFYEMFFDDAIKASQILEITLTGRDAGGDERVPMCGVPYHSAQSYIETLVSKGYKVAICEQVEDPRQAKGVVKREVIQVITPGTLVEGKTIDNKSNIFIGCAERLTENEFAFAYLDVSTGEGNSFIIEGGVKGLFQQLQAYNIRELVVTEELKLLLQEQATNLGIVLSIENDEMDEEKAAQYLIHLPKNCYGVAKYLLQYIERTQMRSLSHIQPFTYTESKQYLQIDANSKRNLELLQSIRGKDQKGTLLWILDETVTAMGGRKLKQWLHQPLANRMQIEERLSIVSDLIDEFFLRDELRELLRNVYDLERLAGRVAFGNAGGRDLAQLRESLRQVPEIKEKLLESGKETLINLANKMDACCDIEELLSKAITDHPPVAIKEGDVIREGYNKELDELRYIARNGKDWIAQLEQKERERTGIKNLKIGFNRVFGYYIEVTKSNLANIDPDRYYRKQTLANAERFITEELKEKETQILHAEEQSLALEYELFVELREQLKEYIPRVQQLASLISELDVFLSFAAVSEKYQFTKPAFHDGKGLKIIGGRHPVVEKMLNKQAYVPNDCVLTEEKNMMLITGPNMSGKSTYMRQVALIVIMAQMGCYVPCDEADLPITDQIFTRIGAADDLASGQSTFMVEMLESQNAITNATEKSLLLFDEIGRGTSTYDGMALAQAMMEYIHNHIGANTLFSTHYHELTALEDQLERLQNVHVSAVEKNGNVVFLHKVKKGAADKSYGVHVAKLANMPQEIIDRAQTLLEQFESQQVDHLKSQKEEEIFQLSLFEEEEPKQKKNTLKSHEQEVIQELQKADIVSMTPIDAMNLLYKLQQSLK